MTRLCLAVCIATIGTLALAETAPTDHWAFQPIAHPQPPRVRDANWCRTPIDSFILAKLDSLQLRPAAPADPRSLIRRVSFDLTGLPPTPDEVEAFVREMQSDESRAIDRLIDRLMASPHYAERWARWWLDVARYADTNGQDENKVMANAWRYRDWVVRAFNTNKRFDQFIAEQLAGDLLSAANEQESFDRLIATGFLVLGPKMLAEQDKPKLVMDIVDEQIDTVGRAFLGLTLGCARCHDHKFDPVPTRDYYAMAGVFKSTRTMEDLAFVSKFNERVISTKAELATIAVHDARLKEQTNRIDNLIREANDELVSRWKRDWPRYLAAASQSSSEAVPLELNTNVLQRLQKVLTADPATNAVSRTLRELASQPERSTDFLADLEDTAKRANASSQNSTEENRAQLISAEVRKALLGSGGVFALPKEPRGLYSESTLKTLKALEAERDALQASAPKASYAMAVADDETVTVPVHLRGSHLTLAKDSVPRGFITVVSRSFAVPPIPSDHSGRLELARWLTDIKNPLTARVIVNRIWQAHFGAGLVRTSENFGVRGEKPTHPELLDWLAREFIDSGWDFKAMHRQILRSAVYQQSAPAGDRARQQSLDSENRFLSYFPRQRLDAEMIRDALLFISGRLERTIGGSLVNWKNNEYAPADEVSMKSLRRTLYLPIVRDRVFDVLTIFDFANPSVCSPQRTPTLVSHQALFFLNSPLAKESSETLAATLLALSDTDDAGRIHAAYEHVLNRPATEAEVKRGLDFLARLEQMATSSSDKITRRRENLAAFCQALFASNEFIYRP